MIELAKQEKKRREEEQDAAEEAELAKLEALAEAAELDSVRTASTPATDDCMSLFDGSEQSEFDFANITKEQYEEKLDEIERLTHHLEDERANLGESQKAVADLKEELAIAIERQKQLQSETEQIKQYQRNLTEKIQELQENGEEKDA